MDWFLTTYTTRSFAFPQRGFLEKGSFIALLDPDDCIGLLDFGLSSRCKTT
jgi:hypothetical protein